MHNQNDQFLFSLVSLSFATEIDVVLSHKNNNSMCDHCARQKFTSKNFPTLRRCALFFFRSFSEKEEFVPFLYFLCARIFFLIRLWSHCCCFYFACCCCCCCFVVVVVVVFSNSILKRQLQSGPTCIKGQIYSVVNALHVDPINLVNTFQLNAWRNCAFDGGHKQRLLLQRFPLTTCKTISLRLLRYQNNRILRFIFTTARQILTLDQQTKRSTNAKI